LLTSLYIPFTDFTINNRDGQVLLYENLVQSGPAYKLIVHESPSWWNIKDNMPDADMIEILSEKQAQEYVEIVNRFFSPVTEAVPYYIVNGQKVPIENLTIDLRRALSYILIAYDYKARIFEDDIVKYDFKFKVSDLLKRRKDVFSEEAIKRVEFVERLISGYQTDNIAALSVNKDSRIFNDLMDLLQKEEIRLLSEKNYLFGVLKVQKNRLKREIKELITRIVKNEWFPYITGGVTLALSYIFSLNEIRPILTYLSSLSAKILSKYDFREYAPPVQAPRLFELAKNETAFFSYKPFNYAVKILVPQNR